MSQLIETIGVPPSGPRTESCKRSHHCKIGNLRAGFRKFRYLSPRRGPGMSISLKQIRYFIQGNRVN
ncbi:hypothetical protein, partial [Methylobacterium platani]|uniref:hypothetical protein n=1 Tax=Methylobacterium platani TaxID=427683 RepID=UPI001AE0C98B